MATVPVVLVLAALVAAAAAQSSCCAYMGSGAASIIGGMVTDINQGLGAQYYRAQLGADPTTGRVAVLINTTNTADEATAGWIITRNASAETITLWYNHTGPGQGVCSSQAAPIGSFVRGLHFCVGTDKPDSLLPFLIAQYSLGSRIAVNEFGNYPKENVSAFAGFTDTTSDCAMISLVSRSALNDGSFVFNAYWGTASAPDDTWLTPPPSICQ